MAKVCKTCNRHKSEHFMGTVCDLVLLSDGRFVHASRVAIGGNLRDELGDDLKVMERNITQEMRDGYAEVMKRKDEKMRERYRKEAPPFVSEEYRA